MWKVPYEVGDSFERKPPQYLFTHHAFGALEMGIYALAKDGRFLMIEEDLDPSKRIDIVTNWSETLKQRIPAEKN